MTQRDDAGGGGDLGGAGGGRDWRRRGGVPPSRRPDPARERAPRDLRGPHGAPLRVRPVRDAGAAATGAQKRTAEISLWMFNYRSLVRSRDGCDPATSERPEMREPPETAERRGA